MRKSEMKVIPDEKDGTLPFSKSATDEQPENEGQLSVDVFQTADEIVVVALVAGCKADDLSITITDEILEIKGRRSFQFKVQQGDYFTQECFWGNFSRSVILPDEVDA